MKKYIIKLLILLAILIILINYENYSYQKKIEAKVRVFTINEDIEEGIVIEEAVLCEIWILKSNFIYGLVNVKSDIVGKVSNANLIKNQIIYKNQFTKKEFKLGKKQRLITVKLNIEESNGWCLVKNQIIDLMLIDNETNYNLILYDVKVLKIFSENLIEIKNPFNSEIMPKYISLIVTESQQKEYFINFNQTQSFIVIK